MSADTHDEPTKDTPEAEITNAEATEQKETPTAPTESQGQKVEPTEAPHVQPVEPAAPTANATPTQKEPVSKKKMAIIGASIAAAILLGFGVAGGAALNEYFSPNDSPSLTSSSDGNTAVTDEENSIAAVAEKVGPSVVSVTTQTRTSSYYGTTSSEAAGTGIFVSEDGYVMTNNHVIEDATDVSVIDSEGNLYDDVEVIGRDPLNDIAFLKVTSDTTFAAAELGNSSTIRTGQQVVAIGNALGQYSNTVTSGIISGTGRPIEASSESGATESLTDLIQTDASINPGNSGGPLVNMAGQVIGINTAIVEDANGIGFAIPINSTKGVLESVLETGEVSRSYLGVSYVTITPDVAREYDLTVNNGAYVYASGSASPVASGSPAAKAGLKNGDIITKVNDETVGTQGSLSSILGEYRAGDKVTLTYLRDGEEKTVTVNLGAYES